MPALAARAAIASGLPPLDLLVYQIHMPLPSNGEPSGGASGWGGLVGGGVVGVGGSRAAWAGAATASAIRARATPARRRMLSFAAAFTAPSPSHRLRGELTGSR